MDADYHAYYRTLRRRRRSHVDDPYRQYRASAGGLPLDAVDLSVAWHADDRHYPLIGVKNGRLGLYGAEH